VQACHVKPDDPIPEVPAGTDLRAEAWAALLVRAGGMDTDRILVRSHGQHGRALRPEITSTSLEWNEQVQQQVCFLDVRRDGLYENLPEALFHEAGSGRSIKRNAAEDVHANKAREFFRPFEQELFRLRVALLSAQLDASLGGTADHLRAWAELWDLPEDIDLRTRRALLLVLPYATQAVGDLGMTAVCFAFVMGHPVSIRIAERRSRPVDTGERSRLGGSALGAIILGGIHVEEWPHLAIRVQEVPVAYMAQAQARERLMRSIEVLASYFLPVHLGWSVELEMRKVDLGPPLGQADVPMLLGLNACLA